MLKAENVNVYHPLFTLGPDEPGVLIYTRQTIYSGTVEGLHTDDYIKIMRVISGAARWQVGSAVHTIAAGDFIILNSSEMRRLVEITSAEPFVFDWVKFTPMIVYPDINTAGIFYRRPKGFKNVIISDCGGYEQINFYFTALVENAVSDKLLKKQAVISDLRLLLIELTRCLTALYGVSFLSDGFDNLHNYSIMTDTLNYINTHYQENLTLTLLASRVHLSASYFSHLFLSYNGINLKSYIRRLRIDKSLELINLESNKQNILDIALSCGFTSASGFYKALRELTGSGAVRRSGNTSEKL